MPVNSNRPQTNGPPRGGPYFLTHDGVSKMQATTENGYPSTCHEMVIGDEIIGRVFLARGVWHYTVGAHGRGVFGAWSTRELAERALLMGVVERQQITIGELRDELAERADLWEE